MLQPRHSSPAILLGMWCPKFWSEIAALIGQAAETSRDLIDRWLAAFCEGDDVYEKVLA